MNNPRCSLLLVFLASLLILADSSRAQASGSDETTAAAPANLRSERGSADEWRQFVRNFRREHHFSSTIGYAAGNWRFAQLGDIKRDDLDVESYITRFTYSFHIPMRAGFGYLLGTSIGVSSEKFAAGQAKVDTVYTIPGVLAGLVWDYSPGLRFIAGIDHYLERYEGFTHRQAAGDERLMSFVVNVTDLFLATDFFFSLNMALRVEFHSRQTRFLRPTRSQDYLIGGRMSRQDRYVGLGLVYHLL